MPSRASWVPVRLTSVGRVVGCCCEPMRYRKLLQGQLRAPLLPESKMALLETGLPSASSLAPKSEFLRPPGCSGCAPCLQSAPDAPHAGRTNEDRTTEVPTWLAISRTQTRDGGDDLLLPRQTRVGCERDLETAPAKARKALNLPERIAGADLSSPKDEGARRRSGLRANACARVRSRPAHPHMHPRSHPYTWRREEVIHPGRRASGRDAHAAPAVVAHHERVCFTMGPRSLPGLGESGRENPATNARLAGSITRGTERRFHVSAVPSPNATVFGGNPKCGNEASRVTNCAAGDCPTPPAWVVAAATSA